MSGFAIRSTCQPWLRRYLSLRASRSRSASVPCVAPSISTINLARAQAKSAIYGPTGCCRRKCAVGSLRRRDQSIASAWVRFSRSSRARFKVFRVTAAIAAAFNSATETCHAAVPGFCRGCNESSPARPLRRSAPALPATSPIRLRERGRKKRIPDSLFALIANTKESLQ